jgi:uncharacterized protein
MRIVLVLAALVLAAPAFGASFDCGKAVAPREKLICADKGLSDADSELSGLYGAAERTLSEAGRRQLVGEQRAWLRSLTQACPVSAAVDGQDTLQCLRNAYSDRIEDLRNTGVRIGPFVFTQSTQYQVIVPPKPDEQDDDSAADEGIGTRRIVNPQIDSPRTPITDRWNAMNVRRGNDSECEDDGQYTLTGSVAFADTRLISVQWAEWCYNRGAAHGYGSQSAETLILSPTPHALQASDLFRTDSHWQERLTALVAVGVHKAFVDDFKNEPKESLDQKAIADASTDPKRWLITKDGLQVLFNIYELGTGYGFAPTVDIPWSALSGQMVDNPPVEPRVHAQLVGATKPFLVDGKPIDPVCLLPLADQTGESSRIDLDECPHDELVMRETPDKPGLIGFSYVDKKDPPGAGLADLYYRYVGEYRGSAVLYTEYSGGGSGNFSQLDALKRSGKASFNFSTISTGDRCNGAVSNAVIEKGQLLYDQVLTPWGLMELGLTPLNPEFEDLESSAVSCVATVHMRDSRWTSITLTVSDGRVDGDVTTPDKLGKHQACFDKVYRDFVTRRETELTPEKFDRFKAQFRACAG